jgi:hypothetical protein
MVDNRGRRQRSNLSVLPGDTALSLPGCPARERRVSRPLRCCPGWLASEAGSSLGRGWIAYGSFPSRVEKYRVRSRPQERREPVFSIKIFSLSDKKEW